MVEYTLEASTFGHSDVESWLYQQCSMAAKGQFSFGNDGQTSLYRDGFLSSWGKATLLNSASGPVLRCGNYGLRVTENGFEKMTNGSTWTKTNL